MDENTDELWSDWPDTMADDIASIQTPGDIASKQKPQDIASIQNADSEAWEDEPLIKFTTNKRLLQRFRSLKRGIRSNQLKRSSKKALKTLSRIKANRIKSKSRKSKPIPDSEASEDEPLIKLTTNKRLLQRFRSLKRGIRSNQLKRSSKKALKTLFRIKANRIKSKSLKSKPTKPYSFHPKRSLNFENNYGNIARVPEESSFNISDYDTSAEDETYIPSDDSGSDSSQGVSDDSVSDNCTYTMNNIKKRKASHREKAWKRKGKRTKGKQRRQRRIILVNEHANKKQHPSGPWKKRERILKPCTGQAETDKALKKSKRMEVLRRRIKQYHEARLDNLLFSNGLKRIHTHPDGDCFFSAVLCQMPVTTCMYNIETFRRKLVEHLRSHKDHYCSFLANADGLDDSEKSTLFDENMKFISEKGHWNTDIADCMPLAVANMFKSKVCIYSSKISQQVLEIIPDLEQQSEHVINLAYIACAGNEHYDWASEKDRLSSNVSTDEADLHAPQRNNAKQVVTPRKRANYKSPEKKDLSRKRKRNPESWKRNKRKYCRDHGLEYVGRTGKPVQQRKLKYRNCDKCRFKCSSKISEETATEIFQMYWEMGSYDRQRNFVCQNIVQSETKRKTKSRKMKSFAYYLPVHAQDNENKGKEHAQNNENQEKVRVCKNFFLGVLNINKKVVEYAMKQKSHGCFVGTDSRGKQTSTNKTPDDKLQEIRNHIESFPTIASHYTRKDTKRKYLDANLSIKKMHELYESVCKSKASIPCQFNIYRSVFVNEYNLSFHKPKKDLCTLCTTHKENKIRGIVDKDLETQYELHQTLKESVRKEKQMDKENAQTNSKIVAVTFDLEAVLPTPHTKIGDVYYKRCLSSYNLSIYSLGDKKGTCYLWDETNGSRGSCEIGTCLINYISSLPSTVKEVVLYSDTCGGQNRNQFVTIGLLYAMHKNKHIEKIGHKFFERGHSEMECDSMHAAVEHAKRNTNVFVPSQWDTIIAMARRNNPYIVIPIKFDDIYDLKTYKKIVANNMKSSTANERVNWLDIKWIEVRSSEPESIFFNYSFDKDAFMEIKVRKETRAGRPSLGTKMRYLYTEKLPISMLKKKDLMSLCNAQIIPTCFRSFYETLPTSSKVKDKLPEPDVEDPDMDSDDD